MEYLHCFIIISNYTLTKLTCRKLRNPFLYTFNQMNKHESSAETHRCERKEQPKYVMTCCLMHAMQSEKNMAQIVQQCKTIQLTNIDN